MGGVTFVDRCVIFKDNIQLAALHATPSAGVAVVTWQDPGWGVENHGGYQDLGFNERDVGVFSPRLEHRYLLLSASGSIR